MIEANDFSDDISADDCIDLMIEQINHPRIKQIVVEVLAEKTGGLGTGSGFGEVPG